jgi:hypothetical protein
MNQLVTDNVVPGFGETAQELTAFVDAFRASATDQQDPLEASLLELMAVAAWQLSRAQRQEAGYLDQLARDVWHMSQLPSGSGQPSPLEREKCEEEIWEGLNILAGSVFAASSNLNDVLEKVSRQQQRLQATYVRLLKALIDLRKSRPAKPTSRRRSPDDPEEQ